MISKRRVCADRCTQCVVRLWARGRSITLGTELDGDVAVDTALKPFVSQHLAFVGLTGSKQENSMTHNEAKVWTEIQMLRLLLVRFIKTTTSLRNEEISKILDQTLLETQRISSQQLRDVHELSETDFNHILAEISFEYKKALDS